MTSKGRTMTLCFPSKRKADKYKPQQHQTQTSNHPQPQPVNVTLNVCQPVVESPLYIILPYFNYCHFARRKQLFVEFVERYKRTPGVALVVVEAALQGDTFDLPNPMPDVFAHFRVITQEPIWLKENLINIGVSKLPDTWRMMAWIDADITFINTCWVDETKTSLTIAPLKVVQLFKTAANLGPDGEIYKLNKGFSSCVLDYQESTKGKYTDMHPGFAWACSRKAYESMGGLIDWAILGSGDRHMALALIGNAVDSAPRTIHPDYKERLLAFEQKCQEANLRIGVIHGSILHHWHGRLSDRKYQERWNILCEHQYNPSADICRSHRCGLIQFTKEGKRLVPDLFDYFQGRKEDATHM